jgi:uncharacterized protein YjbJ (UPF0337 family)
VNKDQVSGKVEQAVGKVKQSVGETLGNERLANQGVVDQAKGAAKETWGNAKDAANEVKQSRQNAATDKAHERRNRISQSVKTPRIKPGRRSTNSRSAIQPDGAWTSIMSNEGMPQRLSAGVISDGSGGDELGRDSAARI